MSYDLQDFTYSLDRVNIPLQAIDSCSLGFGYSPEGWNSWEGGFVVLLRAGEKPWAFIFGWCDTTGWGCKDGAWVRFFEHEPDAGEISAAWTTDFATHQEASSFLNSEVWGTQDRDPADINRLLRGEIDVWGTPTNITERTE